MIDLQGRTALVTAGSRGLGAEIACQLAKLGADVALTYRSDSESAQQVANQIRSHGRRALALQGDAADFQRAQQVVDEVRREFGGIHILVCNAGVARSAPIWKAEEADWDHVMGVSLKGAFNYVRGVAPLYVEQNYGKVVLVGSINGLRGRVGAAGYNTAKAGLVGLAKTAAAELGRYNVNVNVVAPGFVETPSQSNAPELVRDLVLKECAIKRLGTPQDVAPVVAFLASEAARHITGQVIKVDAGQYL